MTCIDICELRLIESTKAKLGLRFTYASVKASWIARAHYGVAMACFMIIGFPIIIAASADLNGIQNGKLKGTITKKIIQADKNLPRVVPRGCVITSPGLPDDKFSSSVAKNLGDIST